MVDTYKDLGYKKVFVSLDGSPQQDDVLDRAITVADNNGAELIIGHVIDTTAAESTGRTLSEDYIAEQEQIFLDSIADRLELVRSMDNIPAVSVVQKAGLIRETLKEKMLDVIQPDLVLCGARGLSNIKYALLGSISTFLLRNSECDILVVK